MDFVNSFIQNNYCPSILEKHLPTNLGFSCQARLLAESFVREISALQSSIFIFYAGHIALVCVEFFDKFISMFVLDLKFP